MIIDYHAQVWEGRGDVKDLIENMDQNDVAISVLHAIDVPGYASPEFVASLVRQYPDRLFGFANVDPREKGAADRLKRQLDTYGFKGLKLHPPLQGFSMADPLLYPLIEVCIAYDVPVLFHTGCINAREYRSAYGDPAPIDDLALRYPEVKIVLAHCEPTTPVPNLVFKHENVYMDTAITLKEWLDVNPKFATMLYERMGKPDRILFGTDHNPVRLHRLRGQIEAIRHSPISPEHQELLFYENAKRLLKL